MPRTIHPGETLSAMLRERRIIQARLARAIRARPYAGRRQPRTGRVAPRAAPLLWTTGTSYRGGP